MGIEHELFARGSDFDAHPFQTERSPLTVTTSTSYAFDAYMSGSFTETLPIRRYMDNYTLALINEASEALDLVGPLVRDLGDQNSGRIMQHVGSEGASEEIQQNIEAFNVFHVVFTAMPDTYISPNKFKFSRRGNLRPPSTIDESLARIEELKRVVEKVVIRKVDSQDIVESDMSLLRTLAFFDTAGKLKRPVFTHGMKPEDF